MEITIGEQREIFGGVIVAVHVGRTEDCSRSGKFGWLVATIA